VLVDDERRSFDTHILFSVHRLFFPRAICLNHLLVRVGQQREIEIELVLELLMRLNGVYAYAQYNRPARFDLRDAVPESASFFCAARCIVFWIKVQNYFLAFVVREFYFFSFVIQNSKIRGLLTDLQIAAGCF
jgi:hypothetical protein